jgi:hypothetical protein
MRPSAILLPIIIAISGCDQAPTNSTAPAPQRSAESMSPDREKAVADQMVRQGVSRTDADATTKAIFDAEREFRKSNPR